MRRTLLAVAITVGGLALFSLGYLFKPVADLLQKPRALVRVNQIEISDLDLRREMVFSKAADNSGPAAEATREDTLDRMINDVLILGEAKRLKLTITDDAVDKYLAAFWQGYEPKEIKGLLATHQLSPASFRELIRRRLLIEQTIKTVVENEVKVAPDEVEEYYWAHVNDYYHPDRVHVRQIVVETQAQAEALKKRLDAGENFQSLAAKYSRGPEKDQGGDLGWVTSSDLPQSFSRVVFRLPSGQVSAPVATEYGYHLFLAEQREASGKVPLDEAKKTITEDLKLAKTDKSFQAWLENLRAQASILFLEHRGVE